MGRTVRAQGAFGFITSSESGDREFWSGTYQNPFFQGTIWKYLLGSGKEIQESMYRRDGVVGQTLGSIWGENHKRVGKVECIRAWGWTLGTKTMD